MDELLFEQTIILGYIAQKEYLLTNCEMSDLWSMELRNDINFFKAQLVEVNAFIANRILT